MMTDQQKRALAPLMDLLRTFQKQGHLCSDHVQPAIYLDAQEWLRVLDEFDRHVPPRDINL